MTSKIKFRYSTFISKSRLKRVDCNSHSAEVPQFAVVSFAPREDLPIHRESHGMASTRMNCHLLHYVITQGTDLTRDLDGPTGEAQAQPAVGGLTTCIDLSLHSHCKSKSLW